MIRQRLSGFTELMNSPIEQPDHVLSRTFIEQVAARYEATVVIKDSYEPSGAHELQIALPQAVGARSLPTPVSSLDSRLS